MTAYLLPNKDNSLSILLLGTQVAVGGAQRVLLNQGDWFHNRGHRVVAAFFYDKMGLSHEWQRESLFPIYNLDAYESGGNHFRQFFKLAGGLWRYWKLLRKQRFDVVETFTYDSNSLGLFFAWLAGVPIRIATHHGDVEGISPWRKHLHTWIVNRGIASVLVAVSNQVRKKAIREGVIPEHIIVIPNGIKPSPADPADRAKLRRELRLPRKHILLLSVGRLTYQKAHEVLIAAMPSLLSQWPQVTLLIAGDGPLREKLEDQINRLGLGGKIHLLGNRKDVHVLMSIADIFVLASRWEGLPMALLEAMSAGLPVVATEVEGVSEVIENGRHGFLVPPEHADALAQATFKLLNNPARRRKMGTAGRQRVQKMYTSDRMCQQYLNVMLTRLQKDYF